LPQDTVLQTMSVERRGNKNVRAEFTCEWFERPLVDFFRSRERLLTISGENGAGKTVLSDWIVERLQRPVGRKVYQTMECKISEYMPF
jgi:ABC-type Mn2+/Zn2+ transport system ATPase subunit